MIIIKLCFLLSIVALVKGNSVERCPACPSCDIGDRSDDLQWSPIPNMALCMYGYDPFEMDRFTKGKPDPGVKKRIFEPTKYSRERNAMALNDFVDYADDINCNIQESTTVVNTMTDFMSIMSGSSIFEEYGSSSSSLNVPLWPISWFVSYKEAKSSSNSLRQESDYEKQRKYFEENNGEAYINKAKCLVYRVSINRYAKAEFTVSFINALRHLQIAAKNPTTDISKRERINFIQEFGTQYFHKCFMGASITTITRMSRKSTSLEEQNRRRNCVSKAYKESNSEGVKTPTVDVTGSVESGPGSASASTTIGGWGYGSEDGFGNRSRQCDENGDSLAQSNQNYFRQSEVLAVGALPFNDRDTWVRETKVSPSPADFRLAPIANLMTINNLKDIPLDPNDEEGEKLDADLLKNFFQDTLEKYCDIMLGKPCPAVKSCHIWNDCNVEDICVDDNSEKGFFCTPATVVISSTGGAAQHQEASLGQYEYHEDKGYYVQTSTEQNDEKFKARYLYREEDDDWFVGATHGGTRGYLLNKSQTPDQKSQTPPSSGWLYLDDEWFADQTLSVNPGPLPPLPRQFRVTVTGAATKKWPSYQGVFTKTQRWWYGRPVYTNTKGRFLHHGTGDYGWVIGPALGKIALGGSRAHHSPVSEDSEDSWRYYTGTGYKPASVTVTASD